MGKENHFSRRAVDPEVGTSRIDPIARKISAFALEEAEDKRVLCSSLWVAVAAHTLLIMINFSAFEGESGATPKKKQTYQPVPPPYVCGIGIPPKTTIPRRQIRRVPVPAGALDDPVPIRLGEAWPELDLPEVNAGYVVIPDPLPAPPKPEGVMVVNGDVEKPVKVSTPQPEYTGIARRARIQGVVIVQAIIDKHGDVIDVKALKGLPMGLTESAVSAIKQWKFKPATLRGKPVDVYYNLTVSFRLQ